MLVRYVVVCVLVALVALVAIVQVGSAYAAPITHELSNITFTSKQRAVGTFTLDESGALTDWELRILGGTNPALTDIHFQPATGCVASCGLLLAEDLGQILLSFRTRLRPDQTFFSISLVFQGDRSMLFEPDARFMEPAQLVLFYD